MCAAVGASPQLSSVARGQATATATAESQTSAKKKRAGLQPVAAVKALLETLDETQQAKAKLEFGSEQRVGWHFIPKDTRKGVPMKEMNATQKEAAMRVLRSAVSKIGFEKSKQIMSLESVLKKLEGDQGRNERNPEKYYFTVFGKPGLKQKWGLSIEGHHLSLNFVFRGNKVLDSTPQFFATNPATLAEDYGEGFPKGLQVLKAEEQLGFKLVRSLSEDQLEEAMLPGDTPDEIRAAGVAQPPTDAPRGISFADLDEEQQETLTKLMKAYTAKMKPLVNKGRWKLIEEAGMEKIKFAWSGAKRPGRGHYYVVQGPTFVIEFINVQADAAGNPANHVHCVWRDMQGDFDLPIK
ncbi:MAG TPA: hypothetical protein DDW52_22545 [Planctomycetaceae bacterium]|nr:hypothetical protein [Planctomycetaceae bacterium]